MRAEICARKKTSWSPAIILTKNILVGVYWFFLREGGKLCERRANKGVNAIHCKCGKAHSSWKDLCTISCHVLHKARQTGGCKMKKKKKKRLLCDFLHLKQLEGCQGDILQLRWTTAGCVNQMGCRPQQPWCGSGALQQKGRVPCMRVATASTVPTERESSPCNGTLPRDQTPLHQWAAPGA